MSLQLYDRVALRASFPEHALRAGDVATLVDFVDHPSSGARGCVLELFNALGESIGVVTVPEDAVEPLRADEVLSVRPLAVAGGGFGARPPTDLAGARLPSPLRTDSAPARPGVVSVHNGGERK